MVTLEETLAELHKQGFVEDFGVRSASTHHERPLSPEEFHIAETRRIDDMADPNEQVIIYAISSNDGRRKGFVVNGFGPAADSATAELIAKLPERHDKAAA